MRNRLLIDITMTSHPTEYEQPERETIAFRLDPSEPESQVKWRAATGTKEEIDKKAEKNGFPSRSAYLRTMFRLGENTLIEQDPTKKSSTAETQDDNSVTIRELVPEGQENAVDMTDEFWEEILRDEMLNIVEQDPEIKRDGYDIYK